jgi:geranylgeranyl diphosphate synthase type II
MVAQIIEAVREVAENYKSGRRIESLAKAEDKDVNSVEEFKGWLNEQKDFVDSWLDRLLPSSDQEPKILNEAMRYSVMAGGKRLRPILVLVAYKMCGGRNPFEVISPACALEIIHSYTLIHDDLPCMDDDDLRRGKPTVHKKYSENIAILAGDAMHALAFELLALSGDARVVVEVARAVGPSGVVGGQVKDVEAEGKDISLEEIDYIHTHKTADLISVSLKIGALLAGASEKRVEALAEFGMKLGLAFQIVDDILDIESDSETLGKPVGSDEDLNKATYPKIFGLEKSKEMASDLISDAEELLGMFPDKKRLTQLADYILSRKK